MKFTTISRRIAATGAATALAAGAVVGASTTTAHADPVVNNQYTCTFGESAFPLFLTTNALGIQEFPTIGAGFTVPGGLLKVTNTFTIPDAVYQQLDFFSVETVSVPTFAGSFGDNPVAVTDVSVTIAGMTDNGNGTWSSSTADNNGDLLPDEGTGSNADFTVPVAGSYSILSPDSLALVATTESGGVLDVPCVIAEGTAPGAYHEIVATRNATTTTGAPTKKQFVKGTAAKVAAAVTGGNLLQGDKVLLKKGTKTLDSAKLNKAGKAVLSTKALPVGKNKVTVVYKQTGYNKGSKSETIIVKVVR